MFQRHIRQEKIVDYVLGQLSNKEHFRVNAHLAKCEQCSKERDYWQHHLHVETIPVPSIELKRKIFFNIEQKRTRNYPKLAYLAVSFCVLVFLTIGIWKLTQTPTMSQPDFAQNHVAKEDVITQLPASELSSFNNIMMTLNSKERQSNKSNQLDVVQIQTLFNYFSKQTNEPIAISNEMLLQTTTMNQVKQQLPIHHESKYEPIIFMNQHALCMYEPENKELICIPIEIDPQTNQLVPSQNEVLRVKYHQ